MPYFRIWISGEAPTHWEREFEVKEDTSGMAVGSVFTHISARSHEQLIHSIHVGRPSESPYRKTTAVTGIFEIQRRLTRTEFE